MLIYASLNLYGSNYLQTSGGGMSNFGRQVVSVVWWASDVGCRVVGVWWCVSGDECWVINNGIVIDM